MKSPYMETRQTDRLTNEEIESLKVFHGEERLLKLLRKVFFQMDLDEEEKKALKGISGAYKAIRKVLQPTLEWDAPIFMQKSPWLDKDYENYIRMTLTIEASISIQAKQRAIQFIEKGLVYLETGEKQDVVVDLDLTRVYESNADAITNVKGNVLAHQYAISTLESGLLTIIGYADRTADDPKQKEERQRKDSAQ